MRRTDLEQIRSRINNNLIAVQNSCTQLTKAYGAETSCNQVVIDSATSLLKISLPNLKHTDVCVMYALLYVHSCMKLVPSGHHESLVCSRVPFWDWKL